MEQKYDDEIEIDLMEILMLLLHYIWVIVIAAVIVGGAAFAFSKFVITPTYESTTRILVLNRQDAGGSSNLTYSDLQLGSSLTKDYPELIQSRYVVEKVIELFELDSTYESFIDKIQVSTKSDSRIIDITITDPDPVLAKEIADALRDIAAERIVEVTDIQAVNKVDDANLPTKPSDPSVLKWTLIGFLLGGFLAAAVVLVRFLLDDTIKSSEDIEKYLHLSTLGLIPLGQAEYDGSDKKGKSARKTSGGSKQQHHHHSSHSGGDTQDQDEEDIVDLGEEE
ncbi:MAG: Wzz/FepE/Etk N-terminal domain-containing protein [Lachnospiraceae bacterium]|nr:Wzz/FepE/Etk N-terminal domain-containing protein [Lachnospiraceae bacterium]